MSKRWHELFPPEIAPPEEPQMWTQQMIERIWCGSWTDERGRCWVVELGNNDEQITRLLEDLGRPLPDRDADSPYLRQYTHPHFEHVEVIEFGGRISCDGQDAGTFERHLYVDPDGSCRMGVTHAELHLNEEFQGQGFLRRWLQETLPRYAAAGIDEIYLNTEKAGGWVWARYGFEFQDGHYANHQAAVQNIAAQMLAAHDLLSAVWNPAQQAAAHSYISDYAQRACSDEHYADLTIAQITQWESEGRLIGRDLLERVEWYGQIETRKLAERVGADLMPELGLAPISAPPTPAKAPASSDLSRISS